MEKETPVKLVIVGGVAGGAATAARARRLSEEAQIIMFERGADVSFANCGMPYFVGGTIENRDQLTVVSAAQLKNWFNIDVRTLSDVRNIDLTAKKVTVFDFATQREYEEPFTHLVISTGAAPKRPCVPGHDLPHCHVLRNLSDMDKIMGEVNRIAASQDPKTKRAVVVGAGFVGLELADNLMQRGIPTTVVEMLNQVFPPVDKEIAKRVEREVRNSGVQLLLGETVEAVEKTSSDGNILVKLNKAQEPIPCGLVIFSVGVVPESSLAKNAGLEIGPRGGIVVDEFMRCKTADAIYTNVYAVGDVVQTKDFVTKNPTQVPLAGPANRQARIAANNVFGRPCTYRGTQSTAIVRVFNATCGITGCSEMALKRQNIPYETAFIYPLHHAEYFPGATFMLIKICFDPATGKLLGAQVVGEEGVDKRVDVFSTSIQAGFTVEDLCDLELAYAPQFGSAKDPANYVGFVAAGIRNGDQKFIKMEEFLEINTEENKERPLVIDMRQKWERIETGSIPGAINLTMDELRKRHTELPKDRKIVVHCRQGQRAYFAYRFLAAHGYDAVNLAGGFAAFANFSDPVPVDK
eukprot:TRINITY_DN688_c0_g1_i19.p1 TRINITY_DN688_c0_g1~~TRINITY_DN688_c0_g1_i19.p1  ORF type:complete len:579 (-),score=122.38 TRINITY_DN688_c0_g1_i19:76-1812(-)